MRCDKFIVECCAIGDRNNTGQAVDCKSSGGVVGQRVTDSIRNISVCGQSRDSHDCSVAGVFGNNIVRRISVRNRRDTIVTDVCHIDRHDGRTGSPSRVSHCDRQAERRDGFKVECCGIQHNNLARTGVDAECSVDVARNNRKVFRIPGIRVRCRCETNGRSRR